MLLKAAAVNYSQSQILGNSENKCRRSPFAYRSAQEHPLEFRTNVNTLSRSQLCVYKFTYPCFPCVK